ncbi:hypothetical protein FJT64_011714 [Amphibalanus amphitrite]|uniref:Uncharacterized protein n=1 Tax=Amphibalanus amphitrite TaxID=1232801 RepID=A0A6A4V1E0_AMPAM|nr:hypothetical protein FJT64_011714 [Amphibalanus amphitrite]
MKWSALYLLCLLLVRGSLAAPQHNPTPPIQLPNIPQEQIPAFLKFLRETIEKNRATEAPVFAAPSGELPPAEAAAEAAPVVEEVVELGPVSETIEVLPIVDAAAEVVPAAEAEVIVAEPVFGPRPDAIDLLAKAAKPAARLPGPAIAALKSRDRPTAGPPTEAQARDATSTPRPYSGYLPPADVNGAQGPEAESVHRPANGYLPPPSDATGPSAAGGAPFTEPEFTFTFESPDGMIPPEFLKFFEPAEGADAPTGGTSRSTTSTWQTFHTYEFQHTAPGTGPSEPGTGASSQPGFGSPGRKITIDLPGDFPDIGAGLLGLAGLGGGDRQPGKGSSNLDQPAPGPDSLIPLEPQLARQVENALNLDVLPLDNPDLNIVENEFHGVTPVVSPAKDSANVFPFRRDGPFDSSFQGSSSGGQVPSSNSQSFFPQNSFTTTTQRPFTHTTAST